MANKEIVKYSKGTQYKAIGTEEKIGSKVFGVKLPLNYEERYNQLPQKERVQLIRTALMSAIDSYDKEQK
jgi:hypothetical protein